MTDDCVREKEKGGIQNTVTLRKPCKFSSAARRSSHAARL